MYSISKDAESVAVGTIEALCQLFPWLPLRDHHSVPLPSFSVPVEPFLILSVPVEPPYMWYLRLIDVMTKPVMQAS